MSEFSRILTGYLESVDAGEDVDLQNLLAKHPDHAERLGRFLSNMGMVRKLVGDSAAAPTNQPDLGGKRLGNFQLIRELGRGGMGIVYEAHDATTSRTVALKILLHSSGMFETELARFRNEVQAAARLSHDHIVPVYSVGEDDGTHYYAMKLIEGASLGALIRNAGGHPYSEWPAANRVGDTQPKASSSTANGADKRNGGPNAGSSRSRKYEDVCRIVADVAGALDHAHSSGVVHRDIKPSNLLVDRSGKVWVTDFGLARLESQHTMTATGDVLGTVQYMSPEQAMGNREVDGRSDIYSLGVILYQLLTGELPFRGHHSVVLRRLLNEDPADLRSLNPALPRDLATICMKCLQKNPVQRYATAQELADDLRHFLSGRPIKARPATWGERTWKWCHRNRGVTTAIVTGIVSTIAIVGMSRLAVTTSAANEAKAREAQELATESELRALRLLYATEMEQASKAYVAGNVKQTRVHLSQVAEVDSERRLRGLEWDYLWRQCSRDARLFCTSSSEIYTVVPSPDGEHLLVAGRDANLQFFDAKTSTLQHSFATEQNEINDITFSPSGKLIATAGDDGTIKVWNAKTYELVATAKAGDQVVWTAVFLSNELIVATCDNEELSVRNQKNPFQLFDVFRLDGDNCEMMAKCGCDCRQLGDEHCRGAGQLCVLPTGDILGGRDAIHRWSETNGDWHLCDRIKRGRLYDIQSDQSRNLLFLGCYRELLICDLETTKPLLRVSQSNAVEQVALFPKRGYVAISVRGGQVIVYRLVEVDGRLERLERVDAWAGDGNGFHVLVPSTDEQRLMFSVGDRLCETPLDDKQDQSIVVDRVFVGDLYSPSFLAFGKHGQIVESDIASAIHHGVADTAGMADYTLSAEAGLVAGISRDEKKREIKVWDTKSGKLLYRGIPPDPTLDRVQISRDGDYVALFHNSAASSMDDGRGGVSTVLDWKANKYTFIDRSGLVQYNATFDQENRIILAPSNRLVCRDAKSGEILWQDEDTKVRKYAIHPRENVLAVGTTSHWIELRDSRSGEIERRIPTKGNVEQLAFTSDGNRLSYALKDSAEFFLIDVSTGRTVLTIPSAFQEDSHYYPATFINNDTVYAVRLGDSSQSILLNLGEKR